MLLDFDPAVVGVASQPFWLYWHEAGLRKGERAARAQRPGRVHLVLVDP